MRSLHFSFPFILFVLIFKLTASGQNKDAFNRTIKLAIPEQNSITIKGNIKSFAPRAGLLDEYAFLFVDMVTGKDVVIPIRKDTAGNFSVTFPVHGYQEIQLTQGIKVREEVSFGSFVLSQFFIEPGSDMVLDYKSMKDYSSKSIFKGNLASSNNLIDKYYVSLRENFGSTDLVPIAYLDSLKPGDYTPLKQLLAEQLKKTLDFNAKYFNAGPAERFLKNQMDHEAKYSAAGYLINALYRLKERDPNLIQFLDSIGVKLNNPEAYGHSRYKSFLNLYYSHLQRETFKPNQKITILFPDMARYLLKEHPEFAEEEKSLCRRILDTVNKASKEDTEYFAANYSEKFADECINTLKTKLNFDQIAAISDPFIQSIFLTRLLREKLDKDQLVNINSLIPRYQNIVKDNPVKRLFLKDYQLAYDVLYKSKLSSKSLLLDAKKLPANEMVKGIMEQYKGKVVYLDIWATWCVPCLTEMRNSKKLRERFIGKDVVFLYLCINSPTESTWQRLIAGHNIEGYHYFLSNAQSSELGRTFNIRTIPRYLILDKDGNVTNSEADRPSSAKTQKEIEALLLQ